MLPCFKATYFWFLMFVWFWCFECQHSFHAPDCLLPDVTTRKVLATPAHGGPRQMKALMYLSFQACVCWLRKYSVYMFPMLWAMSSTGRPAFSAISSIIFVRSWKYFPFSSRKSPQRNRTEALPTGWVVTFCCFSVGAYSELSSSRMALLSRHRLWCSPTPPSPAQCWRNTCLEYTNMRHVR